MTSNGVKYSVVLDLGISGVKGTLIQSDGVHLPEIVKIDKEEIGLPNRFASGQLGRKIEPAVLKTAENLLNLLKEKKESLKNAKIIISMPSPYYLNRLKTVKISRKDAFEIDEKFLENIINEEAASLKRDFIIAENIKENEVEVFEKEIVYFLLNGYPVKNIFKKAARDFEFTLLISIGLKKMLSDLKEKLRLRFGDIDIKINSHAFIFLKVLEKILPPAENNFIFLSINEETNELLFIKEGRLREIVNFTKGLNFFSRRVAAAFNLSFEEGETLLSSFAEKKIKDESSQKIEKALGEALKEWGWSFEKAAQTLSKTSLLPVALKIIGPKALLPNIEKILLSDELKSYTILGKTLEPKFLSEENFCRSLKTDPALKTMLQKTQPLGFISLFSAIK